MAGQKVSDVTPSKGAPPKATTGTGADLKGGDLKSEHKVWAAPASPITRWRPINTGDLGHFIEKPHVPRAEVAADREHPHGTRNRATNGMSVLEQHVAFFDRNRDGIIYPWETYEGFRAIGFNIFLSLLAAFIINVNFSWHSLDGWIPSPLFPIYVKNVHKTKHGGDSEVFDTEGRFLPAKFEEIFSKFDHGNKGGLTFLELLEMTEANRNVFDFFGWFAAKFEWGMTYLLVRDDRGVAPKDAIRGVFDGSFFEYMELTVGSRPHQY